MTTVEQIFQAIQTLPVPERLRLVERVVHYLADASAQRAPTQAAPSLHGFLADEPDLADEICLMAMDARKRDKLRTSETDDEGSP
jgi:hypothetical protein